MLKRTRGWQRALTVVVGVAVGVAAPFVGLAAAPRTAVGDVPPVAVTTLGPYGSVARHGPSWWVNYADRRLVATGGQIPKDCATAHVNGRWVSVIGHLLQKPGRVDLTCHLPAGRPAVLVLPTVDCTTLAGDHGTFGITAADLQRCARQGFARAHIKVTTALDGMTVDLAPHRATSAAQTATVPNKNAFGVAGGTRVRVASAGYVLLVAGLPAGRHTLSVSVRFGGRDYAAVFVLHVS